MDEERRDVERRVQAEMQVEAFLQILAKRYGIEPEDIPRFVETLRRTTEQRNRLNNISWSVLLGILMLAISGIGQAIVDGVKHWLKGP